MSIDSTRPFPEFHTLPFHAPPKAFCSDPTSPPTNFNFIPEADFSSKSPFTNENETIKPADLEFLNTPPHSFKLSLPKEREDSEAIEADYNKAPITAEKMKQLILNNNGTGPLKDLAFSPPKIPKQARIYLSLSKGPGVSFDKDVVTGIKHHAYFRVQLHLLLSFVIHDMLRPHLSRENSLVKIEHSQIQIGKGNRLASLEAAHSFPAGGISIQVRDRLLREIAEEGVSPHKEKILRMLGAQEKDVKEINDSVDNPEVLIERLRKFLPYASLGQDTRLWNFLNSTVILPQLLNQGVDCYMESHIRPQLPEMYKETMFGKVSLEGSCKKFTTLVREHYEQRVVSIAKIKHELAGLGHCFERLFKLERQYKTSATKDKLEKEYIVEYQTAEKSLKAILAETVGWKGLTPLREVTHYLSFADTSDENIINYLSKQASRRSETNPASYKKELQNYFEALSCLEGMIKLSKEATQEPPYHFFTHEYDPVSQKWLPATSEQELAKKNWYLTHSPDKHGQEEGSVIKRRKTSKKAKTIARRELMTLFDTTSPLQKPTNIGTKRKREE